MPLIIDRLPFHCWIDATRSPPVSHWTIVLPVLLTEPGLAAPPATAKIQEWVLDIGNRGEALAWRHHLLQAGLDPNQKRFPQTIAIRTVAGTIAVPIRDADLWLVSNLSGSPLVPHRMVLERGLPFLDTPKLPDPNYQRPLIGLRALRRAGLRIEADCAYDVVSVWVP
jgi:hypothetical protein